jgi:tetratricopeptide (TPR) repeat protein
MRLRPRSDYRTSAIMAAIGVLLTTALVCDGHAQQAAPTLTPQQQQAQVLVKQAQTHLDNSQWDQALQVAARAIQTDPKSAGARVARGAALNGKGEYDKAIEDFDWVAEQKGRDSLSVTNRADAFASRSFSYFQKGEYLEAVNSAYFATLERGDHVSAHTYRAAAYIAREDFDKALNSANRAIRYDEKAAEAYSHRGYAYAGKGNFNQAIVDLDKAIELKPGLAIAFQRRGGTHTLNGDLDKATADLNKALTLQPTLVDALCDRAYLHGMKRDMTAAHADLDRAIQLKPDFAKAHFLKGRALLTQGNFDGAIGSFTQTIKLKDDHAAVWGFRGSAYHSKEDYERAVEDFTQAIELKPNYVDAYKGRSQSLLKLKKRTESRADLAKVKELTASPKKEEQEPQRFVAESKEVSPGKLVDALRGAKRIDQLVAANYAKHKIRPNSKTTDAEFLRRIYLDITGTIPTNLQTRRFLLSKTADKRARLIDDLLNSVGYASHSFNYWADVLRYTDNLNSNVRGDHYRQWIKQSLAGNKPWDRMVNELLTAEGLIWDNPATGYLQRDASMPLDNMNNTVRIFLGTRIGCAQCHDHPFDRWTQKEFYQMAAFTFGTLTRTGGGDKRFWNDNPSSRLSDQFNEIEQEEEDRRRNYYRFNRLVGFNMQIVNDQASRKITLPADYAYDNAKPGQVIAPKALFGNSAAVRTGEVPRKAFARWVTSKDNPRFALTIANRLWKRCFGVGQIEPVDDMMDDTEAENPALMAFLESEMKRVNFDMKQYLRMIFNSETYQRQACSFEVHPGEPFHFAGPILRRMTAEQLWDSILTLAVVDPNEYREPPATVRSGVIDFDLNEVSAPEMLSAISKEQQVGGQKRKWQTKYIYKGVLLARASELPSPVPANHFLRTFGQSNRELISSSSKMGSVPQVLFMFNGPISHMMLEKNSTIYNNVKRASSVTGGVTTVFRTVLNRDPDEEELAIGVEEIKQNGPAGYGNVIWSLVNTREFMFIQ